MKSLAEYLPKGPLETPLGGAWMACAKNQSHPSYESIGTRYNFGRGLDRWTGCPLCKAEAQEMLELKLLNDQQAEREEHMRSMLGRTAIPSRFVGKSFDSYRVDPAHPGQQIALDRCRKFAQNFEIVLERGSSMVMSGGAGTGKSHLATSILQAILPKYVGMYITVSEMIRMLRNSWGNRDAEHTEVEVMAKLTTVPLLVIDEVGVQSGSVTELNQFFEVMDGRYRGRLPTILLTNENPEGFRKFVGDRVNDRLRETSRWVSFEWESHRKSDHSAFK